MIQLITSTICLWEEKSSVNQLASEGNNIFFRKRKVTLTRVDQYLSRDPETLNGTKITEALWRTFQTLQKKIKKRRISTVLQNCNMRENTYLLVCLVIFPPSLLILMCRYVRFVYLLEQLLFNVLLYKENCRRSQK